MKHILFTFILVSSQHAAAEIYKWTDEHGNIHFGDRPSAQVEKQRVDIYVGTDAVVNKSRSSSSHHHQIQENISSDKNPVASTQQDNCQSAYEKFKKYSSDWQQMINTNRKNFKNKQIEINQAFEELQRLSSTTKQDFLNACYREHATSGKEVVNCLNNSPDAITAAQCMAFQLK